MSTFKLSPSASEFYDNLTGVIEDIKPRHRVQVLVPREISHHGEYQNGEVLESIQTDFRDSVTNQNVFIVLRYDMKDEAGDVYVDVCHFSS